jgi:cellobiose epimerase
MRPLFLRLFTLIAFVSMGSNAGVDSRPAAVRSMNDSIAREMRRVLDDELARWYPLCIDTVCGGYYSDLNYKWELDGPQQKMVVTQARHVWAAATAAMFYQREKALRRIAAHGVAFLQNKMWDSTYGGFFNLVERQGNPILDNGTIVKQAYGIAFAIYGLAACYRAFGDTAALRLAIETFRWLDTHGHDPVYGGYFQFLTRDGTPYVNGYGGAPAKDQNSSIHLLECFTELYRVWPDPVLKERLQSCLRIVRDTITTPKGYMHLFFQRDWTPVSYRDSSTAVRQRHYDLDHVSFGHDIETAYLLLEASEVLGLQHDTTTLRVAKTMVDHGLDNGFDKKHGGVFDGGYYFRGDAHATIVRNTKEWWVQTEAFNSFLMMADLFPKDPHGYYRAFRKQWDYCKQYLIDREHGGWYWGGVDSVPQNIYSPKGSIWKGNYHTSRALINCIRRLTRPAHSPEQK